MNINFWIKSYLRIARGHELKNLFWDTRSAQFFLLQGWLCFESIGDLKVIGPIMLKMVERLQSWLYFARIEMGWPLMVGSHDIRTQIQMLKESDKIFKVVESWFSRFHMFKLIDAVEFQFHLMADSWKSAGIHWLEGMLSSVSWDSRCQHR